MWAPSPTGTSVVLDAAAALLVVVLADTSEQASRTAVYFTGELRRGATTESSPRTPSPTVSERQRGMSSNDVQSARGSRVRYRRVAAVRVVRSRGLPGTVGTSRSR